MKRLICEMCGSADLVKDGGVFVCQGCGCKYSVEEAKKMMAEGAAQAEEAARAEGVAQDAEAAQPNPRSQAGSDEAPVAQPKRKKGAKLVAVAAAIVVVLVGAVAVKMAAGGTQTQAAIDKSPYVGEWVLVGGSDEDLSAENLQAMGLMGMEITLTLKEDGTGTLDLAGERTDLTWDATSAGATATVNGKTGPLKQEGGKLVLAGGDGNSMTFAKPGEAKAGSSDAAGAGTSGGAASGSRSGTKSGGASATGSRESTESEASRDSISYRDGDYEYLYTDENGESMYYDKDTGYGIYVDKDGNKEWTDGYGNHHPV